MPKNCDTCKYDLFRLCGEEDKTPCDDCYNGNPPTKWEPGENYEPKINADRIRAMSDEELAWFMADRNVNESTLLLLDKDHGLTAVEIDALRSNIYCALRKWLEQPAEGE